MNTLFETHPKGDDEPNCLTLWDMKGAFFVLLTGLSIAIVSYSFELIYMELTKIIVKN